MKTLPLLAFAMLLAAFPAASPAQTVAVPAATLPGRLTFPFDASWRFLKDDATGAQQATFNDSAWRSVDVPHDWSVEGVIPFDRNAPTGIAGGMLPSGVSWYRKSFTLPPGDANRRVSIEFDGVMANSEVWINGFSLGKRPYGYISFRYDLTGHLNFGPGQTNVLAVRTDTSQQPASRWAAGAGIYRHVRLVVTDAVHVQHWGLFVTTPKITPEQATVQVQTAVVNDSAAPVQVAVQTTLNGPDGKPVQSATSPAQTIPAGQSLSFLQDIPVATPKLWNLESPNLYSAVAKVVTADNQILDHDTAHFGIRQFEFKPESGFWLNGKNFKILGAAVHSDGGAVGAAVPLAVWEHRLNALRELGVNAIRCAHNPPSPEFLDLCDRLGFLVMDEMFDCWTVKKNDYDYHLYFNEWSLIDTRDTVLRDRNHPSIILYSAGNEIHDTPNAELSKRILAGLVETFHKYDPTRPVTQALFRPNVSHDYDNGLADLLDVIGTNYRDKELIDAWRANPTRKIIGTEQTHDRSTWLTLRDNPMEAGQFLWSGIDYLGEGRTYPNTTTSRGLIDRPGEPRGLGLERASWWSSKPVVYITRVEAMPAYGRDDAMSKPVANWNPLHPENYTQATINVFSNCEEVELSFNGESLGTKPLNADASPRVWRIPYAPGTLKAVAKNGGQIVATDTLSSAGAPAKLKLTLDHSKVSPTFDDVAFATVTVLDADGVRCPWAENLVNFEISGPGRIAAVDNGNVASLESYQATQRQAFEGRAYALLKATGPDGKITLTATAEGLAPASITLDAAPLSQK